MPQLPPLSKATIRKSLLFWVGIAVATLFILAVIGAVSSLTIAETNEGYAAAINQAGTLRMQSYRIASSLIHGLSEDIKDSGLRTKKLVSEFDQRLLSPRIHNVLSKQPSDRVKGAYRIVEDKWKKQMQPILHNYVEMVSAGSGDKDLETRLPVLHRFYLSKVDSFVDDIHRFVKVLELDAEEKIQQLRFIQIVVLALALLIAVVSVFLTKRRLLRPLHDLQVCATAARRGDFSIRSTHTSEDELGQLGAAFNVMAEDLSKIYADLEDRVKAKTADLERSNRSLELMYSTATRLGESSLTEEMLQDLIHDIEHFMEVKSGTICLGQPGDKQAYRMAYTRNICRHPDTLTQADCSRCLVDGTSCMLSPEDQDMTSNRLLSMPIKDQAQQHGVLLIELKGDAELEEWQHRLLETVANHIALAINVAQRASQNRMVSLLEERSVIARELHDSLAQTLSYLKIQVTKLDRSIMADGDKGNILAISAELREALNGAYRQLRELLKTFRLRITEAGLGVALEETVQEFRDRGGIEIEFINRITNCRFSPNAEIHIVQIIRESLSNVIRHAEATHARVFMECDVDGLVSIIVDDDGVGIDMESDTMLHYGLPIMQERAEWLGGELKVEQSPSGGTRIALTFNASKSEHADPNEELRKYG